MAQPASRLLRLSTRLHAAVLPHHRRLRCRGCVNAWQCSMVSGSRTCSSTASQLALGGPPRPLAYSVELSLPHLRHRCPFVLPDALEDVHDKTVAAPPLQTTPSCPSLQQLMQALTAPTSTAPVHTSWQRLVRLCEALVEQGTVRQTSSSSSNSSSSVEQHERPARHTLVGAVLPCKEPYFSKDELKRQAANGRAAPAAGASWSAASCLSTAQAALMLFHSHWHVPATLALNTTVPNRTDLDADLSTIRADGNATHSQPSSTPAHSSAATADGIDAVVDDVLQRRGGRSLLLVRGDTPPDLHRSPSEGTPYEGPLSGALRAMCDTTTTVAAAAASAEATAPVSASPVSSLPSPSDVHPAADPRLCTFQTGADLVRHVAARRFAHPPPQLFVAGYPQGHPLERLWDVSRASAAQPAQTSTDPPLSPSASAARRRSLTFLDDFEKTFDAAAQRFASTVSVYSTTSASVPAAPVSPPSRALRHAVRDVPMPELQELYRTLGRIEAVRRLWTTPSAYPPPTRNACTRQMLREKVRPAQHTTQHHHHHANVAAPAASSSVAVAVVVVTQLLASAAEFEDYLEEVRGAVADDGPALHPQASLEVIPGVLLPHPTDVHVLLRSLYYAKVVPSARMQAALEDYALTLTTAWRQVASTAAATTGAEDRGDSAMTLSAAVFSVPLSIELECVPNVEALVRAARQRASRRFADAWMTDTVGLLRGLSRAGHTRVHFFTMFNDEVDRRVAQLLAAYDGEG